MNDNVTIHRELKERNFVQIPNELLADEELSFRAKGILCYLLGKPDDWRAQVSDIYKHGKEGKLAIRTALKELRKLGYARLERVQTKGRFDGSRLFISDYRRYASDVEKDQCLQGFAPCTKKPRSGNPHPENPRSENRSLSNNGSYQHDILPIPIPAKPVVVAEDGDAWPAGEGPVAVAVRPLEATVVEVTVRGRRAKVAPAETPLVFPEKLGASEPFRAKWAKWVEVRRAMRKPKRWDVLFQEQLDWLATFTPEVAIQVLSASIMNGWQGLFAPKNGTHANGVNGNSGPTGMDKRLWSEELKRVEDEIKGIYAGCESHHSLNFVDAAIVRGLRERANELKAKLGFKV